VIIILSKYCGFSYLETVFRIFDTNNCQILLGSFQEKHETPGNMMALTFISFGISGIVPWLFIVIGTLPPGMHDTAEALPIFIEVIIATFLLRSTRFCLCKIYKLARWRAKCEFGKRLEIKFSISQS